MNTNTRRSSFLTKPQTSPISEVLRYLPRLTTSPSGTVDFSASDPAVLSQLATNADTACKTMLRGLSAVGILMSHAGPEIEDGSLSADAVEALGLLVSEIGELSGMLVTLKENCGLGWDALPVSQSC